MKRYIVPALAIIWILSGPLSGPAVGEVPGLINYQGKLTDELGSPVNRETEISFAIYTEASGGGAIWSEVQNVTVTDGIFNVLLGSVNSLSSGYFETEDEVYLGVAVGGDQEMASRQKIASAAFALRAEISDLAKDLTSSGRISLLEAVDPVGLIFIFILQYQLYRRLCVLCAYGVTKMVATRSTDDLFTTDTDGGGSNNNLPPYIVVYMWKRTS